MRAIFLGVQGCGIKNRLSLGRLNKNCSRMSEVQQTPRAKAHDEPCEKRRQFFLRLLCRWVSNFQMSQTNSPASMSKRRRLGLLRQAVKNFKTRKSCSVTPSDWHSKMFRSSASTSQHRAWSSCRRHIQPIKKSADKFFEILPQGRYNSRILVHPECTHLHSKMRGVTEGARVPIQAHTGL